MARNGSGTYSLPAGNPVVTGTTISSTTHNNTMSDIATALTNSLAKDGQTTPTANLPMGDFRITGLGDATTATDAAKVSQVQNSSYILLSSMSGTDTITATLTPTPSAYASGQLFIGVAAGTNTGATTLNLSSLGAKNVFYGGKALTGGEISEGQLVGFRYDGTQFELIPLNFISTDSGASAHPTLPLYRNSGTPADSDELGEILFDGNDDGGNRTTYASAGAEAVDVTDTTEDGGWFVKTMGAGTLAKRLIARLGLYTPNATGGDKGADSINASEIYDDGVQIFPLTLTERKDATNGGANDLTSVEFTGLRSGIKRITVMFRGVSLTGTDNFLVQIGDSGGFETSGYDSDSSQLGSGVNTDSSTSGLIVKSGSASVTLYGDMTLTLMDADSFVWSEKHAIGRGDAGSNQVGGGGKALSAELDRVRVTVTGSNTFDGGTIALMIE